MVNRGFSYREVIDAGGAGVTALSYMARHYRHSSLVEWGVRFERSEVLLDGAPAAVDQTLRTGQTLVWNRPPWHEGEAPLHFEVVHEDEALLAVSKPAGLPTLPAGGYLDNTLLTLVQRQYPGADPVHRLGRYTSGLVLFARTDEARASLTRALRERRVRKSYRALATGVPEWHRLEIRAPIGLVPHPRLGTVYGAVADGRGKPSLSTVELVLRSAATPAFLTLSSLPGGRTRYASTWPSPAIRSLATALWRRRSAARRRPWAARRRRLFAARSGAGVRTSEYWRGGEAPG